MSDYPAFDTHVFAEDKESGLRAVSALASQPNEILFERVDILSPRALGVVFDSNTLPRVQATIIAGAATSPTSWRRGRSHQRRKER